MTTTLSDRALNRALLARQQLLARTDAPTLDLVERLVGLQAQVPSNPYVALWSRIEDFDPQDLSTAIETGAAVRASVIRPTIHLVTLADAQRLAPLNAPVMAGAFRSPFGRPLEQAGVDPAEVAAVGLAMLHEHGPQTRVQLTQRLLPRWPDAPADALAQAVVHLNATYQVPPRGLWDASAQATFAPLPGVTGDGIEGDLDALVLRYLAAFGPAAVADMRTWSRLTGLRPAFERLRGDLLTFRDTRGRELFDVPDAPRPDPDTPAPPRLLPEYDNVLLAHEDRSRVIAETTEPGRRMPTGTWIGHVLVDGFRVGSWKVDGSTLTIRNAEASANLEAEGAALLELIAPAAEHHEVVFA